MINSLMSRMNAADNLSVQQLHQAVADGTLPAYVGVPMIQDKMKQQQQAMAMQQPMQQPPIADQIMAASAPRRMPRREVMPQENQVESEVAQAPEQGIEAAPSNLPTQMAQGGILSFADGGMDDQTEDDEMNSFMDPDQIMTLYKQSLLAVEDLTYIPLLLSKCDLNPKALVLEKDTSTTTM